MTLLKRNHQKVNHLITYSHINYSTSYLNNVLSYIGTATKDAPTKDDIAKDRSPCRM